MGFEIPGEQEEDRYDARRPAEDLDGEGLRNPWDAGPCAMGFGAKGESAYQGYRSRDEQHAEGVENSLVEVCFRAEKSSVEDGEQGDHAGEESDRLCELQQHAVNLTLISMLTPILPEFEIS